MMNNESKSERFTRLAEARTRRVLEDIRKLGNLANTYAYEYDQQQVAKVFGAIETYLRATRTRFELGCGRQDVEEFRL